MNDPKQFNESSPFVMPSVGDMIYMPSMLYLRHGADDFHGGKCHISKVRAGETPRSIFIEVAEWPGVESHYLSLLEQQEELKTEYGNAMGHMAPDHRHEFNDDPY